MAVAEITSADRRAPPRPVYLVGLQRSGTNMLARGLDIAPEFEVHNENDRAVFDHYLLRDDDVRFAAS